jgi:hypothetical protein
LARCHIEQNRPQEALEALSQFKPNAPEYATAMFLSHALNTRGTPTADADHPKPNITKSPMPEPPKPAQHAPAIAEKPASEGR